MLAGGGDSKKASPSSSHAYDRTPEAAARFKTLGAGPLIEATLWALYPTPAAYESSSRLRRRKQRPTPP